MSRIALAVVPLLGILGSLAFVTAARADLGAWGPTGAAVGASHVWPDLEFQTFGAADHHGGMLVVTMITSWTRGDLGRLEATHVTGDGKIETPGRQIVADSLWSTWLVNATPDGAGGAFVLLATCGPLTPCWVGQSIRLFHIGADARREPHWPPSGVPIPLAASVSESRGIALVADGQGGVIVAWPESLIADDHTLVAQRWNGSGQPKWPATAGLSAKRVFAACNLVVGAPQVVADGQGGAILASGVREPLIGSVNGWRARIGRIGATGTSTPWGANGVALDAADDAVHSVAALARGADGHAHVTWSGDGGATLLYQVLQPAGTPVLDPAPVLGSAANALLPIHSGAFGIVPVDAASAYVAWVDAQQARRVQYIADGAPAWTTHPNGRAFGGAGVAAASRLVEDGVNGAWFTWSEGRNNTSEVVGLRLDAAGVVGGGDPPGDCIVCGAGDEVVVSAERDGARLLVAAWRPVYFEPIPGYTENETTYVQQVVFATSAVPPPADAGLSLELVSGNPLRSGSVRVRFALPARGHARLELFDLAGRRVGRREWHDAQPGPQATTIVPATALAPGVYTARLSFGARREAVRFVRVE